MRRLRARGRTAPLCLAAAFALSAAPAVGLAQDTTRVPGEPDDGQTLSDEVAAETERQLDRQRREREEQEQRDPIAPADSPTDRLDPGDASDATEPGQDPFESPDPGQSSATGVPSSTPSATRAAPSSTPTR